MGELEGEINEQLTRAWHATPFLLDVAVGEKALEDLRRMDFEEFAKVQSHFVKSILDAQRAAILRLAREIDDLRGT